MKAAHIVLLSNFRNQLIEMHPIHYHQRTEDFETTTEERNPI